MQFNVSVDYAARLILYMNGRASPVSAKNITEKGAMAGSSNVIASEEKKR